MRAISTIQNSVSYRHFFLLFVAIFTGFAIQAQTVLISPTGDGGFETGSTFAANGWTAVNYTSTTDNNWVLGTGAAGYSGNRAAYVSNNSAATPPPFTYTSSLKTVHFYRDIVFPAGQPLINFSFSLRQVGESGWDRVLVYISDATPVGTPVTGTPASTSTALAGYTLLLLTPQQTSSFATINVPISQAQAGNATAASTRRILFVWQDDGSVSGNGSGAIDNISLTSACVNTITGIGTSAIGVTTATLNWNTLLGATGYTVRYKKITDPITVSTWATPTTTATNSLSISMLLGSTGYEFQVSPTGPTVCNAFSASVTFTTPCAGPSISTTTPATRCGAGTVTLGATASTGSLLRWFNTINGGVSLFTGGSFTTPPINTSTTYYVSASTAGALVNGTVGAGASTSSSNENPFYYLYGGQKCQFIIRAAELTAAGLAPGNFSSLGLDVVAATGNRDGFAISMANTTAAVATSTFINGLTTVYSTPSVTPTVGINTYTFTTPFVWDGVSNIVVQTCFSNNTGGFPSNGITVKRDAVPYLCLTYAQQDYQTPATICALTSGSNTSNRPQMTFAGQSFCEGPRTAVIATVTPAPPITLSYPQFPGVCPGSSATLNVSSPNSSYTYAWTPGTQTGASITVSPAATTTYIVVANDAVSGCTITDSIKVNVSPVPQVPTVSPSAATVCQGTPATLIGGVAIAPAVTATIGTGTITNSTFSYPTAYGNYWGSSHGQHLIRASELSAAGLSAGNLNSIAFDLNVGYSFAALNDYTIKMAPTSVNALSTSSFESTGFVTVYNNSSYTPPGSSGWATLSFSTPFLWDGTSNIIVDISFVNCSVCNTTSNCATSYSSNGVVNQSATSYVSSFSAYADGNCTIPSFTPTSPLTGSASQRPNMRFVGAAPAFPINWLPISGLYKDTLLTMPMAANDTNKKVFAAPNVTTIYTAVSNNNGCKSAPSNTATVTIIPAPIASIIPAGPQKICPNGGTLTLSVPFVASNTYQWIESGMVITGATSNSYVVTTPGLYTVHVASTVTGCEITSDSSIIVTTSILPPATISAAGPVSFCSPATVTLNANTGGGLTYQWLKDTVNVAGATASSYAAGISGDYQVRVSNSDGCSSTSSIITVTANVTPSGLTASGTTTFCLGGSVTLSAVSGSQYTYQFKKNGVNIVGATNNSYTINGTANGTDNYSVTVTDTITGCIATTSPVVPVTVGTPPPASISPAASTQAVCSGSTLVLTSNTALGLTYQWLRNNVAIPNATASTYGVTLAGNYTVQVSSGPGCTSTSSPITITVNPTPSALATANGSTTFCQGDSLLISASNVTNVNYQWQLNGNDIAGATTLQYTARQTGNFRVTLTDGTNGCVGTSNAIAVIVNPIPVATIAISGSPSVCQGSNVVLSAGNVTGRSYQWSSNGVAIVGATGSSYTTSITGNFTVRITNNNTGCFAISPVAIITVNALPAVNTTPSGTATLCTGTMQTLSVPLTLGTTYQWKNGGVPIAGATFNTYVANSTGSYSVTAIVTASGCTATSAPVVLSGAGSPSASATFVGSTTTFCEFDTLLLRSNSSASTYQWLLNGAAIPGAIDSTYAATQTGMHAVQVTNAAGCKGISNSINLTVLPAPPAFITFNSPITFCEGGAVVLDASPGSNGLTYQWLRNGFPIGNSTNFHIADTTGNYQVIVTGGNGCTRLSAGVPVVAYDKPTPIITANGNIMDGGPGYSSYQWARNGVGIGGATNRYYTAVQSGAYEVVVYTSLNCQGRSEVFFLNAVGIGNNPLAEQIRVFPNPNNGLVYVDAPVVINVEVLDMAGRAILNQKDAKELNLKSFADGLYMLKVMDADGQLLKMQRINKVTK